MGMIWERFKHLRNLKENPTSPASLGKSDCGARPKVAIPESGDDPFEIPVRAAHRRGEMMGDG
jgi:hypothetical protein